MNELTGGRCTNCGHVSWPAPKYCPEGCGATVRPVSLANEATVYVSTVLNVPHPVFGPSYQVGYADLGDGPRVFGHFESLEPVEVGMPVTIGFKEFGVGESDAMTSAVVFRPAR